MDLVAALLRRRYSVTFEELSREVPGYANAPRRASVARMFERDKDELRSLGVPIETVREEDSESAAYRLRRRDFYLPYLAVEPAGAERGLAAERPGYRDLPRVVIERDEFAAIDEAARCVRSLGDPVLAADAEAAIRKLAFDLPAGTAGSAPLASDSACRTRADARVFELLDWALGHRKRVTFSHRVSDRGHGARREVEPFGLFFRGGHWYLVARDPARRALRDFRLDRLADLRVNDRRAQSPDYEVPAGFDLREHARWCLPWELGDREAIEAIVEFRTGDGIAAAGARLGEPVESDERTRRFLVRRMPPFVRWLLSLGGDAIPVAPSALVSAFRSCALDTLALYQREKRVHSGRDGDR